MTPAELDHAYGLRPGTVAGWIRSGIIPAGLAGERLEHAALAAYTEAPGAEALASREAAEARDRVLADWTAAVRAADSRYLANRAATEAVCPIADDDPAGAAASA